MDFKKRLLALIIDFVLVIISFTLLGILEIFINSANIQAFNSIYYFCIIICLLYLILKDVVNGKSIGKSIMKIKVINSDNGKRPSIFQLFIRNITIFIWPIEAILLLIGKKRLGDILAKTDVG